MKTRNDIINALHEAEKEVAAYKKMIKHLDRLYEAACNERITDARIRKKVVDSCGPYKAINYLS